MIHITLNGQTLKTPEKLHERLKEKLGFPDYYGANADALYDMLSTDTREMTITLKHMEHLGVYGEVICAVLSGAAQVRANIHLKIAE